MEPELVVYVGLVLALYGYAGVGQTLGGVIEEVAPAALVETEHAFVLRLVLLLLVPAELLQQEREQHLRVDALRQLLHAFLQEVPGRVGQHLLRVGVVHIRHDQRLVLGPGHLSGRGHVGTEHQTLGHLELGVEVDELALHVEAERVVPVLEKGLLLLTRLQHFQEVLCVQFEPRQTAVLIWEDQVHHVDALVDGYLVLQLLHVQQAFLEGPVRTHVPPRQTEELSPHFIC